MIEGNKYPLELEYRRMPHDEVVRLLQQAGEVVKLAVVRQKEEKKEEKEVLKREKSPVKKAFNQWTSDSGWSSGR